MAAFLDLTGQRFGRLTVLSRAMGRKRAAWHCRCDCGGSSISPTSSLRSGRSQSCGCLQSERTSAAARVSSRKHGQTGTPEHVSWGSMLSRCYNQKATGYERYGGSGVVVCERWKWSFENFLADMGERPSRDHSLDRFPNAHGNYEPGNCRWATKLEQANNRRDNHLVVVSNRKMTVPAAMRLVGCKLHIETVKRRLALGWPVTRAMSEPPRQHQ
jgi:hypothetical protein